MVFKEIDYSVIIPYKEEAEKAGLKFLDTCQYFGIYSDEILLGFCALLYSGNKATFKCEYVFPQFRRRGLLKYMLKERIMILKLKGIQHAEANCTPMSRNVHLSMGGVAKMVYKNGITKIVYENL